MLIGIIMTVLSYSVMIVLVGVNTNIKKLKYEWYIIPVTIGWPISQSIKLVKLLNEGEL